MTLLTGSISPGRLGQFVLYAAFAASSLGQLSEVWGEVSAASGAAERLFEILHVKSAIVAPASPRALPQPARGDVELDNVSFAYPTRPDALAVDGVSLSVKSGEKVAIVGPSGAGKARCFTCCCGSTIRHGLGRSTGVAVAQTPIRASCAPASRWCRRTPWCSPPPRASCNVTSDRGRQAIPSRARGDLAHASEFIRRLPGGVSGRSSASVGVCNRAASAMLILLRGRSCATRRCCCWMKRPRRSMLSLRRWCRPRWKS